MATNNNADEYADARLNIFFPGNPASLTGQCVSLIKWFLQEMSNVPNPQAGRGNAKDFGDNLVSQGLADLVDVSVRKRGDIVVWKSDGGGYGHIGVLLSGDRIFEENAGLAGTPSAQIPDGEGGFTTVYASRIDPLYTSWRKGSPTFYRVKSYTESENSPMSNTTLFEERVLAFEVGGRNGLDGTQNALNGEVDAELIANHVGAESNAAIAGWYNSDEGQNWINKRLPALAEKSNSADALAKQVDTLTADNEKLVNEHDADQKTIATLQSQLDDATNAIITPKPTQTGWKAFVAWLNKTFK